MISWSAAVYGALLSAVAAGMLAFAFLHERRRSVLAVAVLSAAVGPFLWNAILHHVDGREFFVDAPVSVMPASWQDTGSGVFAVAAAALAVGFGPGRDDTGRRLALLSLLCGIGAFLVDVYLY